MRGASVINVAKVSTFRERKLRGGRKMTFSVGQYNLAVEDYNRTTLAMDETMYALCRRFPSHDDENGVNAKLWIIGRTYMTGIERKIHSDGALGGSMTKLAKHLLKHRRKVDRLFSRLRGLREPLEPAKLRTIIDVHGQFISLLQSLRAMRRNQSPRSFASKYMHFHCPTVPIIDTIANRTLCGAVRWKDALELFDLPAGADEGYAEYVFRFFQLYKDAIANGVRPTVKHLDSYVLWLAE
jgi:hypothetical protein